MRWEQNHRNIQIPNPPHSALVRLIVIKKFLSFVQRVLTVTLVSPSLRAQRSNLGLSSRAKRVDLQFFHSERSEESCPWKFKILRKRSSLMTFLLPPPRRGAGGWVTQHSINSSLRAKRGNLPLTVNASAVKQSRLIDHHVNFVQDHPTRSLRKRSLRGRVVSQVTAANNNFTSMRTPSPLSQLSIHFLTTN